jgi:2-phospho-L-lactate/phosphoenolpyruvate guanylyltransferase
MPVPLVPVKALAAAKGRLDPWLSPLERRLLAIAMFEDVVAALQATPGLQAPLVVSPDREIWRRAEAIGCRVVEEPAAGAGLNAALAAAATRCLAEREASAGGDGGLLVVAADLPLASAAGLRRVLEAAAPAPVVVVPSHDGDGTNVLAWREPPPFRPGFGPGSAARHLSAPGAVRVDDPGLALDVDTVEDLRLVAGRVGVDTVTGRRLRDLRLPARLAGTG